MMYNTKFISAVALLSGAQVNAVQVQATAVAHMGIAQQYAQPALDVADDKDFIKAHYVARLVATQEVTTAVANQKIKKILELAAGDFEKALKIFDVVQETKLKPEQAKEALLAENWNKEHTIAIHLVTSATGLAAAEARDMLIHLKWEVELPQQQQQVIQQPAELENGITESEEARMIAEAEKIDPKTIKFGLPSSELENGITESEEARMIREAEKIDPKTIKFGLPSSELKNEVVQQRRRRDLRKPVPYAQIMKIKEVADFTSLSENDALYFLALNQWQVEKAINYYLELDQPAVDKFVQVTGAPVRDAVPFLKRNNFEVDKALNEYFK